MKKSIHFIPSSLVCSVAIDLDRGGWGDPGSLFRRRMQRKSARNFDVGKGNESRGGNRKIGRYTMWK